MKIRTKPRYSNIFLECQEVVGWRLTVPWKYFFDHFASCFLPVTVELKQPWTLFVTFLIYLPIYAVASCVTFPLAVIGFCMLIPIRSKRLPYLYSYVEQENPTNSEVKKRYCIGTSNLCLLPDYMSRFNNLHNTYQRATRIGAKILEDQFAARHMCNASSGDYGSKSDDRSNGTHCLRKRSLFPSNPHIAQQGTKVDGVTEDFATQVLEKFPEMDFLLLQETWYKVLSQRLAETLHNEFPWVVYDASYDSIKSNSHVHNSGLMIASRYEIEEVDFNWFRDFCSFCRFNSKGLLQIKVRLGEENGVQKVGYLATTHLQVFQGNKPIHVKQLDSVSSWLDKFRQRTLKSGEMVAFDVVGGDFNFDNISPVDHEATNHEIFKKYVDVGRTRAGQDHIWAVGTECRPKLLHDTLVTTPHGLKLALEDPILLQNYMLDADWSSATLALVVSLPERDSDGNIIPSPVGGRRRIDFLLYRKEDKLLVSAYNPISSLAALTDHIPLCLTVETK